VITNVKDTTSGLMEKPTSDDQAEKSNTAIDQIQNLAGNAVEKVEDMAEASTDYIKATNDKMNGTNDILANDEEEIPSGHPKIGLLPSGPIAKVEHP